MICGLGVAAAQTLAIDIESVTDQSAHADNDLILAREANRRGDLFGRLMADLFVALGYDAPRLNIAKSGREVDLEVSHRFERSMWL